ncbi:MAG TPA: hypothetical protein P5077_14435, partial [bacterium]|nr:hypothetical protein [bacterium]
MRRSLGLLSLLALFALAGCENDVRSLASWGADSYYGDPEGYDWETDAAGMWDRRPNLEECSREAVNLWILDKLWDMYLWYDHLAEDIDFRVELEPGDFLGAIKY